MQTKKMLEVARNALGRGVFPHEMAWVLDLPGRGLIMSAKTVARRLPVAADAEVLEIGAGSGYYSVEVARKIPQGKLALLDIQPDMLALCEKKLTRAGIGNYSTHPADGKSLPFDDHRFDAIFMVTVFGEIEGRKAFLDEARRVLKPGGILSITEHHPDPDFEDVNTLTKDVESHGFRLLQTLGWRWAYTANFAAP